MAIRIIPYFYGQGVSISEPYMQVVEALNLLGDAINSGHGGGGGGFSEQVTIDAGLVGPVAEPNSIILWNSTDTGAKVQPLPPSTGSLSQYTIVDVIGTASFDDPIVPTPESGLPIIGPNPGVYTAYSSITLVDTILGYVYI